jgi:outer membrane immunogenic protein
MLARLAPLTAVALLCAVPVSAANFTGPRAEVRVGYDRLGADDDNVDIPDTLDGASFGGAVGYDHAIGSNLIVGIEAGLAFTINDDETVILARDRLRLDLGRDFDVMARIGTKVSENALVYAKAGYANSRIAARYSEFVGPGSADVTRYSENEDGIRLATGVEYALGERAYVKGEYRHTDYGNGGRYQDNLSRNQLIAGFGYRF